MTASATLPVTVVIPARNAAATIGRQLTALSRQAGTHPFHVIVVDNGSTDATAAIALAHQSSRFTLEVVCEGRPGINVARNAGVARAADGLVLLCDADDEVTPSWVDAMVAAHAPGEWLAGVVNYSTLNSSATRRQWGAPSVSVPSDPDQFGDRTFGCNCGFPRALWVQVGGFDERLSGIGGDETEMFIRARAAGFRQRWVPDAEVAYRLRPGVRNMCRQRFRQGRNQVYMSRIAVGSGALSIPGPADTWKALGRLTVAFPKYAVTAPRRYEWLAAWCRHVGRLVGYRSSGPLG